MVKRFITFLRLFLPIILLSTLVVGSKGYASSVTLDVVGVNDPYNKATAVFDYTPDTGTLNVSITNTSDDYDPRITAFAFNLPDVISDFTFMPAEDPKDWQVSFNPDNIKTPEQLGKFDIAVMTGKNFGGGDPNDGIARGNTMAFKIEFEGDVGDLAALDTTSFTNLLSVGEDEMFPVAVRFQRTGLDGEGSDMGAPGTPGPPGIVVPEPSTLFLFGFSLIGMFGLTKKIWK